MFSRLSVILTLPLAFASLTAFADPCSLDGGPAAIEAKRAAKPFLAAALNEATLVPHGDGCYRHYQNGSVYWTPRGGGAFEVHGDIRAQWAHLGWELSSLGFPLTDETTTPDGVGKFNHFQEGSVYWRPETGAHMVSGAIRDYWAAHGWERNPGLGYPINGEMQSFPVPEDRYQDFENGLLYLNNRTGAVDEVWPFPPASRSKEDLEDQLAGVIDHLLASASGEAYRDGAPTIQSVTTYRPNGLGGATNRALVVHVGIKYSASFLGIDDALPDPSTDLTLVIRLGGRRRFEGDAVLFSVMESWRASTHVPFPTNVGIGAGTINDRLRGVIEPMVNAESELATLPAPLSLLSAKVTAEGGFKVYVAPLD